MKPKVAPAAVAQAVPPPSSGLPSCAASCCPSVHLENYFQELDGLAKSGSRFAPHTCTNCNERDVDHLPEPEPLPRESDDGGVRLGDGPDFSVVRRSFLGENVPSLWSRVTLFNYIF